MLAYVHDLMVVFIDWLSKNPWIEERMAACMVHSSEKKACFMLAEPRIIGGMETLRDTSSNSATLFLEITRMGEPILGFFSSSVR